MGRKLTSEPTGSLARLMEALGAKRLDELSEIMVVPYSTVRNWHTRGRVPDRYLLWASQQTNRPFEWFYAGNTDQTNQSFFLARPHIKVEESVARDASARQDDGSVPQAGEASRLAEADSLEADSGSKGKLQQNVGRGLIDLDAMRTVVEVVAAGLQSRGLELPPAKLAELVVLVYEQLAEDKARERPAVERAVNRYLRLVS